MRTIAAFVLTLLLSSLLFSQSGYKLPPKEIIDMVDAPPTPFVSIDPTRTSMLLAEYPSQPPLENLARPIHRIAGMRIDAARHSRQRIRQYSGFEVVSIEGGTRVRIATPKGAQLGFPAWSPDGKRIAFEVDRTDRVELWWADIATGTASQVKDVRLNGILTGTMQWSSDGKQLLVLSVPAGTKAPPALPAVPDGPAIDETAGRISKTWTYQDMISSRHDEDLFAHYAMAQMVRITIPNGRIERIGKPGFISSFEPSPDGTMILVETLKEPFSYRVPYYRFAHTIDVWNASGAPVATIADLPVADNVPTQGVPTGPRSVSWQPQYDARLIWIEALDGGDPSTKAEYRDGVLVLDAPFAGTATSVLKIQQRYSGFSWTGVKDQTILFERDRDRRWITTSLLSLTDPEGSRKVLFDMSWNDAYNDPGDPVMTRLPDGSSVTDRDGSTIYLSGRGATPDGYRPFLDSYDLGKQTTQRLFSCADGTYERFVSFVGQDRRRIVISSESPSEPPNYVLVDLRTNARTPLTAFKDPAPQMTGMSKQLLSYTRADGVPLSGTLYLPAGYKPGTRLPCLIWAYPLEYSDASTAGQVRSSPNSFTFFRGTTPLFFVTQGYAVLMDATMPVVGDPQTMNDTFVEQIVSSSKAAIDTLDAMGVIDRKKVLVSGHSYGAFMTANVLAHSDLFAAGIARSGAYNRTLTPFGFQSERRTFWEAQDVYIKLSPFSWANKINEPILLIHGEADNNTGTYPIQSERMFQAIRANGGTARLVMLPYESHGYSGRESVLHVLAEMFEWGEKHVKNRGE